MRIYKWNGIGDYEYLIRLSEEEMKAAAQVLPKSGCLFETSYYFVNVERKRIAAPPCVALILGGAGDGCPPYSATDAQLDLWELLGFEGEDFRGRITEKGRAAVDQNDRRQGRF